MMADVIHEAPQSGCGLSARQRCAALAFSRATYYRRQQPHGRSNPDEELCRRLHRVAGEWPAYGYRRLTHALRRQGLRVNHKRVLRLMREEHLLCRRRRRGVHTTNSRQGFPRYPNLLPTAPLTGLDQVWQAEITYIRLPREFVYLAVILDAFSRRCLGWAVERTLTMEVALGALRMALAARPVPPGVIHHSDQGVQSASTAYTETLHAAGLRISMSRQGNPYDNAKAESFFKTLKYEEVYLWEYENLADARQRIGAFVEDIYNRKRLHSALGYRPPVEFEQSLHPAMSA
jgi:putative transposase